MKVRLAFCLALALLCMGAATITDVSLKRTILTSNQVVGVFVEGQVPVWNAAMGAWSNSTPATGGSGDDTNSTYLLLSATNGLPNSKRLIADGVTTRLLTNGGDVVITNIDTTKLGNINASGTNIVLYGGPGATNWTFTDTNGWHNTNVNGGNVNISQGNVTASGSFTGLASGLTNANGTALGQTNDLTKLNATGGPGTNNAFYNVTNSAADTNHSALVAGTGAGNTNISVSLNGTNPATGLRVMPNGSTVVTGSITNADLRAPAGSDLTITAPAGQGIGIFANGAQKMNISTAVSFSANTTPNGNATLDFGSPASLYWRTGYVSTVSASNAIVAGGTYYPSNALTIATIQAGLTNGGCWQGMLSNLFQAVCMSNNAVTFTILAPKP